MFPDHPASDQVSMGQVLGYRDALQATRVGFDSRMLHQRESVSGVAVVEMVNTLDCESGRYGFESRRSPLIHCLTMDGNAGTVPP